MFFISVTALIPAMQIHLLDCKSSNAFVRQFATQKLNVCMLALSELRDTHRGAEFVFEMFQRAQNKLLNPPVAEQGSVPEPASVQTDTAAEMMQTTLPSDMSGASRLGRRMTPDDTPYDYADPYGVSDTFNLRCEFAVDGTRCS